MIAAVIPAAGKGSRLLSDDNLPKALFRYRGTPLISFVLAALPDEVSEVHIVINERHVEHFREWQSRLDVRRRISFLFQTSPVGSLDAVREGIRGVDSHPSKSYLIIWADQIGVSKRTLATVCKLLNDNPSCLVVPVLDTECPYVWLDIDDCGVITRVSRQRDHDQPPRSGHADLGVFGLTHDLAQLAIAYEHEQLNYGQTAVREQDFTYILPYLSRHAARNFHPIGQSTKELVAINSNDDVVIASQLDLGLG